MGNPTKMENVGVIDYLRLTYSGKRVFLTGHTGFKGSWMLSVLSELGAEVYGYSLPTKYENDLFNLIDGKSLCIHHEADIREAQTLKVAIRDFQPDFIFHLAAQALVIESYQTPVETYATNVMGTIHVLDALRGYNKSCTSVIITTDKVYENLERIEPYREDERLGGYDPYSNSKACAELAVSSYRNSFFNPVNYQEHQQSISTARSGNVIGGGDWSENRILPDLVKAMQNNEKLTVRNPLAVRPWQHVLDPLYGYLLLGAKQAESPVRYATGYNFGPIPEDELTVEQLVKTALEYWGQGSYEKPEITDKPHEAGLLKLAINKAQEELKWHPSLRAKEAIELTLSWYKNYHQDPAALTTNQIKTYFKTVS